MISLDPATTGNPTTPEAPAAPVHTFTNGPLSEAQTAEFWDLRRLIKEDPDVHEVMELEPHLDGRWLYLVRLPLHWSWPKYAIGTTDSKKEDVHILHECGAEWCAQDAWAAEIRKIKPTPAHEG